MATLIVAMDDKFGIGYQGSLPWYCKEDLALFKSLTMGKNLIVGRKTYDNLPKLPGRTVLVLTHDKNIRYNIRMEQVKKLVASSAHSIVFIGGAKVYKKVLKHGLVSKIHLSLIKSTYTCDTFFDRKWMAGFVITDSSEHDGFTHFTMELTKNGEQQYLDLLGKVLDTGEVRDGRNGSTISLFNNHMTFDLRNGFPLLTTKRMFTRGIIEELLFFLRGDTDTKILEKNGVKIWSGNTSREFLDSLGMHDRPEGCMGPMYGYQWRHFDANYDEKSQKPLESGIDQLEYVVNTIKTDPNSRRIMMTTFNPRQVNDGVLYPCHSIVTQFYVQDQEIDMFCYNRSQDLFLGVPFNIASSALLLVLVAKLVDKTPRFLHFTLGDTHIYSNHVEQARTQLARQPYKFPSIKVPDLKTLGDLDKLTPDQILITDYNYHPGIKAEMVV